MSKVAEEAEKQNYRITISKYRQKKTRKILQHFLLNKAVRSSIKLGVKAIVTDSYTGVQLEISLHTEGNILFLPFVTENRQCES